MYLEGTREWISNEDLICALGETLGEELKACLI